jgi:predicted dehydrogenase
MHPLRVGVVGCGNIASIYLQNLQSYSATTVRACADLDVARAQALAKEHGVPKAGTVESLLSDPEIDLVLNLTVPKAHAEVHTKALQAGKHVYGEKPFTLSREEGLRVLGLAQSQNLTTGCAPDTFLGAGIQLCRRLIDQGAIGEPVGFNSFMLCHGHESWHPSPEFYYEVGGGPLFDMGPYYLTALVTLLGPVRSVNGLARKTFATRTITSEPKRGKVIEVETPTHLLAAMTLESGVIGQLTTSFDVWHHEMPHLEIYGTEGSLQVPDPNGFGGVVRVRKAGDAEWESLPATGAYSQNSRGVGVLDMAYALRRGRSARAHGGLAFHVLDIMQSTLEAAETGKTVTLESGVPRPAALPMETVDGMIPD